MTKTEQVSTKQWSNRLFQSARQALLQHYRLDAQSLPQLIQLEGATTAPYHSARMLSSQSPSSLVSTSSALFVTQSTHLKTSDWPTSSSTATAGHILPRHLQMPGIR